MNIGVGYGSWHAWRPQKGRSGIHYGVGWRVADRAGHKKTPVHGMTVDRCRVKTSGFWGNQLAPCDGIGPALTRADADGFDNVAEEDFAITDFTGVGGLDDGVHDGIGAAVIDDHFNFDFGEEVHCVFATAVDLGMAFLTAKTFDFHDGHTFHSDFREGLLNILQFEGFNDRFDFFHGLEQLWCVSAKCNDQGSAVAK